MSPKRFHALQLPRVIFLMSLPSVQHKHLFIKLHMQTSSSPVETVLRIESAKPEAKRPDRCIQQGRLSHPDLLWLALPL